MLSSCFPSSSIKRSQLVKTVKVKGQDKKNTLRTWLPSLVFHKHQCMVDKTVATECCLCYRNGALSVFLGQDRRKWLSPDSYSHFSWFWVFLTRIRYFIPSLLFDPCNCLLPCLSALVLTKGPLCHLLIHPDSSWMQLILSSFLCAGPVNFWGCEALCACSNGAFFLVREVKRPTKEITAFLTIEFQIYVSPEWQKHGLVRE